MYAIYFPIIPTLFYVLGTAGLPDHRDCQAQTICRERFCTTTMNLKVGDDDVSLGISMPPADSGLSEFMMNASVPVPYGFASITMGDKVGNVSSPFVVAGFFIFQDIVDTPMNISNVRSQIGTVSGEMVVTNPNIAKTTISSKSAMLPTALQIVSRIQSPILAKQPLFSSPSTVLHVTLSMNAPQYLDSANDTAILDLEGSETVSFVFERSCGTFANYTEMVEAVGL